MADQLTKVMSETKLCYDGNRQIGKGAFGTVFKCFLNGNMQQALAVKRIEKSILMRDDSNRIKRETENMLKAQDHCNILRYFCTESDSHFWYIVTELCNGTLDDYVKKLDYQKGSVKFQSDREVLLQITQGLDHLHRQKIVHRDIKPSNILIFAPSDCDVIGIKPLIKLADFGLSKLLKSDRTDFTNSNMNPAETACWTSPELYDHSTNRYDFQVDIFPLGCLFGYTLSGGKHPFGDDHPHVISSRIIRKEAMLMVQQDLKEPYSNDGSSAFKLIQSMVDMDPGKRPTAGQVLRDAFFKTSNEPYSWMQTTEDFVNFCTRGSLENLSEVELTQLVNRVTTEDAININAAFIPGAWTILHFICLHCCQNRDFIQLVGLLLDKGANVNALDHFGESPLHNLCESYKGDYLANIVNLFIEKGADIHLRTPNGWNLIHVLCRFYNNINLINVIRLLVGKNIEVTLKTSFEWTPLHFLLRNYRHSNMIDLVRLLIDNGADVNEENDDSWTPLHNLIHNYKHENMIEIVQLMIEKGADVNAPTSIGFTPIYFLKFYHGDYRSDIERLLRDNGAIGIRRF